TRLGSSLPEGAELTLTVSAGMTSFAIITSLGNVFWVSNSTQVQLDPAAVAVTFDASGLDESYGSTAVLTVDGSSFTYSSLPKTFEWTPGSVHSYAYVQSFSTGAGSRVGWVSARGLSNAMAGTLSASETGSVISTYSQQYLLNVTGGGAVQYVNSLSGDGWYDAGSVGQFTTSYAWSTGAGSRQNLYAYSLDGASPTSVVRSGSGTFTSAAVTMAAPHTVKLEAVTQYQLAVSGGSGVTYSPASQTDDGWYDSGSTAAVTTNCVWGLVAGESRIDLVSWSLDGGANQSIARAGSGTFTTATVTMNAHHAVDLYGVTQYFVTEQSSVPTSGSAGSLSTSATWVSGPQSASVDSCFRGGLSDWEEWYNYGGVAMVSSPVVSPCSSAAYGSGSSAGMDEFVSLPSNTSSVTLSAWLYSTVGWPIQVTLCSLGNGLSPVITSSGTSGYSFYTATAYYSPGGGGCSGPPQPTILVTWACTRACQNDGGTVGGYADDIQLSYTIPRSGSSTSAANSYSVSGFIVTYSYGIGFSYPSGSTSAAWSATWPSSESYSSTTCSGASVSGNEIGGSAGGLCTLTTTYGGSYSGTLGTSPTADGWYDSGTAISISASASGPFAFSSWSAPAGITLSSPSSASTTALVSGYGTISSNFMVTR
ncbi:MAG TPA: hypothetical protein VEC92_03195, partial [Nitrososphaerales archaeon]|nr:hypothetical protein [Nitrososphaerales archaeon]